MLDNKWQITFFASQADPRKPIQRLAPRRQENPVAYTALSLNLPYKHGGPSELKLHPEVTDAKLPKDHFGTIATTNIEFPPGHVPHQDHLR